ESGGAVDVDDCLARALDLVVREAREGTARDPDELLEVGAGVGEVGCDTFLHASALSVIQGAGCLDRNAIIPALASSLLNRCAETSAVHANASVRGMPGTLRRRFLVAASACGPPLARASTYAATTASTSSAGTALLMRPACATRAAGTRSPSSSNSIPSRRFIRSRHTTEITAGATPTRPSENAKCTSSLAT